VEQDTIRRARTRVGDPLKCYRDVKLGRGRGPAALQCGGA